MDLAGRGCASALPSAVPARDAFTPLGIRAEDAPPLQGAKCSLCRAVTTAGASLDADERIVLLEACNDAAERPTRLLKAQEEVV